MRHYQEHEIEFRRPATSSNIRGLVVYVYGGKMEEVVKNVRKELGLSDDWDVVNFKSA
jgi:hypothetical protein